MQTDPIADMLTRIRNAAAARKQQTLVPHSKIKEAIAGILKANEFIVDYSVDSSGQFKQIVVELAESATPDLKRISKPGRRIYAASEDIPTVLGGRGIVIVSTSKGLMTGRDARKQGLGGELICKVS